MCHNSIVKAWVPSLSPLRGSGFLLEVVNTHKWRLAACILSDQFPPTSFILIDTSRSNVPPLLGKMIVVGDFKSIENGDWGDCELGMLLLLDKQDDKI